MREKNEREGTTVRIGAGGFAETVVTLDEPKLALPFEKEQRVLRMVQREDDKMTANVAKCFVAQQKYIDRAIDSGCEVAVPARYRWKKE